MSNESQLSATFDAGLLQGKLFEKHSREDQMCNVADDFLRTHGIDPPTENEMQRSDDDYPIDLSEMADQSLIAWKVCSKVDQIECTRAMIASRIWYKQHYDMMVKECKLLKNHSDASQECHSQTIQEYEELESVHEKLSRKHAQLVVDYHECNRRIVMLSVSAVYAAWISMWFCAWLMHIDRDLSVQHFFLSPIIALTCVGLSMVCGVYIPRWTVTDESRLYRFYSAWNRDKATPGFIRAKSIQYKNNMNELFKVITNKYGPEPNSEPAYQFLSLGVICSVVTVMLLIRVYEAPRSVFLPTHFVSNEYNHH